MKKLAETQYAGPYWAASIRILPKGLLMWYYEKTIHFFEYWWKISKKKCN